MGNTDATTRRHAMRSVSEAARDVGVPEAILRQWIAEGDLFAVRLGPAALVDLGEVKAVRDRRAAELPARRKGFPPAVLRAIGLGDVAAGAVGAGLFLAHDAAALQSPWSLALSLLCLVIGALLLRQAGWPGARRWG